MQPDGVIRILLADDHPIFRDGLTRLLETDPAFRVVGVAGDGSETLRLQSELRPDLLLLDLSMPTCGGLDVLRALGPDPPLRIVVLTADVKQTEIVEALQFGARGVLLKEAATPLLFKCIRCVMQGEFWIGREHVADVVHAFRGATLQITTESRKRNAFGLTPREMQIVAGVESGESNREIAQRLSIREHTVKHHLTNIFDKVGVFSRLELAVFAINHRLGGDDSGGPPRPPHTFDD
jgi:two-component system, NarL family, nitrate/nitrite response regulator NarL